MEAKQTPTFTAAEIYAATRREMQAECLAYLRRFDFQADELAFYLRAAANAPKGSLRHAVAADLAADITADFYEARA